jgi:hypothetical protein
VGAYVDSPISSVVRPSTFGRVARSSAIITKRQPSATIDGARKSTPAEIMSELYLHGVLVDGEGLHQVLLPVHGPVSTLTHPW